jgi:hypothetical protein
MTRLRSLSVGMAALILLFGAATSAQAQRALRIAYVCDRTGDDLVRFEDLNRDGDYNDPGEQTLFWDSALAGAVSLDNVSGIDIGPDGAIYVTSVNSDQIARLEDIDGDGSAHGAGEATVYFDGNPGANLSGIEVQSVFGIHFDDQGRLWFTNSNSGSGGTDAIYLGEDLNGDGDLLDAGEVKTYYAPPTSGGTGDSLPADVHVGLDGNVYYLEVGSTGVYAKGVYKLEDIDGNGVIDPMTEVTSFWLPTLPVGASNQFFWSLTQGEDGTWYSADTLNERLYAYRDDNGNGFVDVGTAEETVVWTALTTSNNWQVEVLSDGAIYLVEDQTPDRILLIDDVNEDGFYAQIGETSEIYNETVSATGFGSPRAIVTVPETAAYLGNGSDLAIEVLIDGRSSSNTSIHAVTVDDVVTLNFVSPGGTRDGALLAVVAQVFNSGTPAPALLLDGLDPAPSVYLDLMAPISVVLDGLNPSPGVIFAPVVGSQSFSALVPANLAGMGMSVMVEAFCADPALNGVGLGNAPSAELRIL